MLSLFGFVLFLAKHCSILPEKEPRRVAGIRGRFKPSTPEP